MPWMDNTFIDKEEKEEITGASGSIVDSTGSVVKKRWAEWSVWWDLYPIGIGYILKSILWAVTSTGAGPTYQHVFSLLESNTHQSITTGTATPLWDFSHPLTMIESMEISASVWEKAKLTVNLKGKKGESAWHTVTYTSEQPFISSDMKVYLAGSPAGLDGASNICLQSITLTLSSTLEDVACLSSGEPLDYLNTKFVIEGAMELYFDTEVQKNKALNGDHESLRIDMIDTDVDLGWWTNPSLQIDLSKVSYREWTPSFTIDGIVKQTVNFKGHHNWTDAITATLVNTQSTYA